MSAASVDERRAAVGRRIEQARRELGLTQSELAAKIGVSLERMDRYETGRSDPSDSLGRIAEVTGRQVPWFMSSTQDDADLVGRIDAAIGDPSSSPSVGDPLARAGDEDLARRTKGRYGREGGVMDDSTPAGPEASSVPSALPAPPLNIRYEELPRKTLGYSQKATAELFDRIADAYRRLWEDRTKLERRLDKLQVELAEEREKLEQKAAEDAGLTAEKLKRAENSQRQVALQLEQVGSALAASREQESQLSRRVSELETELQLAQEREQQGEASKILTLQLEEMTAALAASRAQERQLSQRVSELESELQQAEERDQRGGASKELALELEQVSSVLAGSQAQESRLSQRVSELETKLQLAEDRAVKATEALAPSEAELERFRDQEHSLAEALIWAQHTASELSEKAEREAKQIVEDAERKAAELLSEGKRDVERTASELSEKAEQEAKRIVQDAERKAAELLSEGRREVERLTNERHRLEALAKEVQEDLSAFLLGALERLNERVEPTTQPDESVSEASADGEPQRMSRARQS